MLTEITFSFVLFLLYFELVGSNWALKRDALPTFHKMDRKSRGGTAEAFSRVVLVHLRLPSAMLKLEKWPQCQDVEDGELSLPAKHFTKVFSRIKIREDYSEAMKKIKLSLYLVDDTPMSIAEALYSGANN